MTRQDLHLWTDDRPITVAVSVTGTGSVSGHPGACGGLGEPVPGRVGGGGAYGSRTAMTQLFMEMVHAVFVRTVRPGVTYEQFKDT